MNGEFIQLSEAKIPILDWGGDCKLKEVRGYSGCHVTNPEYINDGICHAALPNYYSRQCMFDGGDCYLLEAKGLPGCYVVNDDLLGDGICQVEYNTKVCDYDGGDCIYKSVEDFPYCYVKFPLLIGNSVCDADLYNTTACDYDGGDCILQSSGYNTVYNQGIIMQLSADAGKLYCSKRQ